MASVDIPAFRRLTEQLLERMTEHHDLVAKPASFRAWRTASTKSVQTKR